MTHRWRTFHGTVFRVYSFNRNPYLPRFVVRFLYLTSDTAPTSFLCPRSDLLIPSLSDSQSIVSLQNLFVSTPTQLLLPFPLTHLFLSNPFSIDLTYRWLLHKVRFSDPFGDSVHFHPYFDLISIQQPSDETGTNFTLVCCRNLNLQ